MAHESNVVVPESGDLYKIREMIESSLDKVNGAMERAESAANEAKGENKILRSELAEIRTKHETAVEELTEIKERTDHLDKVMPRGEKFWQSEAIPKDARQKHERQEFGKFIYDELCLFHGVKPRFGTERAQTEGTTTAGGHAVPSPLIDGVVWIMEQYGFARQKCTVIPMTSKTLDVPTSTAEPTLTYPGELTVPTESNVTLVSTRKQLSAATLLAYDDVSIELQEDATPGFLDFLVNRFTKSVTGEEDNKLFNANNSPTGWYGVNFDTGVGERVLGTGSISFSQIDHTEIINTIDVSLEDIGEGEWVFNRKVLHHVRKLVDSNGQPLLAPLMAGAPPSLLGYNWNIHKKMPKTDAVDTVFIAFGPWDLAYFGDRRQMTVGFSEEAAWKQGGISMRVMERYAVMLPIPSVFGRLSTASS